MVNIHHALETVYFSKNYVQIILRLPGGVSRARSCFGESLTSALSCVASGSICAPTAVQISLANFTLNRFQSMYILWGRGGLSYDIMETRNNSRLNISVRGSAGYCGIS